MVISDGYGFSKPFRLMQIESADGQGFLRSLQEELINKGFERVARFSWKDMAKDKVAVYKTL